MHSVEGCVKIVFDMGINISSDLWAYFRTPLQINIMPKTYFDTPSTLFEGF